jgi:hypothetical protein
LFQNNSAFVSKGSHRRITGQMGAMAARYQQISVIVQIGPLRFSQEGNICARHSEEQRSDIALQLTYRLSIQLSQTYAGETW